MSAPPARSSNRVALTLVAAAAAGSLALFGYGCLRQENDDNSAEPAVVIAGQSYENNHYIPGAGYFHAPFGMWFPYRYNEYRPGSGYYFNGGWHPQQDRSSVARAVPDPAQVSRVNSAWRSANPDAARQASRNRSGSSGFFSRSSTSRSAPASKSSSPSSRGGFGRSGGGFSGS